MTRVASTVLVGILSLAPMKAFAFMSVADYVGEKDAANRAANKIFLSGIVQGLQTYNGVQMADKQRVIFCVPPALAIGENKADNILSKWAEVRQGQATDKLPIGLGMMYALAEAFPCQKSN